MNLEQPCIRISVRNLVEFILRHGDIDNRTGGADKEAMQQGGRIHRKIQRQQGAEYRAEVSLKYQIACDGFILSVEGRADGIIELPKRVVIDEIKGVFKDLKRLKEPQLLHLAQAKCYAYIYAEQKNLEEIGVQMTYCNLDTEEIRRFQEVYTRAELKKWFEELVSEYEKWARYQMEWRAKRNASIKTVEFPFEYRDGQKKLVASVYRTILRKKKLFIQAPTGVGKTELVKLLSQELFNTPETLIRLDMSEFMEKHSVSRIIGSPPGYVGYDEAGQLTEKVRRRPYSVILFDEIEKAHPDVFNMLLQILDDGILTDSQGRRVDFKNCIIIMTSNVGAKLISGSGKALGFSSERGNVPSYDRVRELVMKELKNTFRPEFLNRVDDIIVFHSLEKQDISEIARRMLETLSKRVAQLDITLIFDESAVQKTADAGFDPVYGARPLKRVIQQQIEDKLSEQMLEGKVTTGKKYICKAENGEFVLAEQTEPESAENE